MERSRVVRGVTVPSFLYGTAWKEERTGDLVRRALAAGFRGIDTANQRKHYFEAAVGEAVTAWLSETGKPRSSVFLQTKFTYAGGQDHRLPYDKSRTFDEQVRQSFSSSLEHLETDYVDSYVLHGPFKREGLSRPDLMAWGAMEELHRAGKALLLGVSNVSLPHLRALVVEAKIKPAFVQNRCFAARGWDAPIRAFCAANEIVYQGFSLLTANAQKLASPEVVSLASRFGKTIPQVVFRFALELGMLPLTGTSSEVHLAEDLASFDFDLDDAAIRALESP